MLNRGDTRQWYIYEGEQIEIVRLPYGQYRIVLAGYYLGSARFDDIPSANQRVKRIFANGQAQRFLADQRRGRRKRR